MVKEETLEKDSQLVESKKNESKPVSELRMDLVSNDWVVIATGRGRRPETFAKDREEIKKALPADCPFCQSAALEQGALFRLDGPDGQWKIISIKNKFPAFAEVKNISQRKVGPNRVIDGHGYHEVIITRDHEKQIAQFSKEEIKEVLDVYQARYLDLMNRHDIKYISIFHNHGREAGASIEHPHSQLIAIPVIDPHLRGSIEGAAAFYRSQGSCVYCTMLDWELKDRKRIIYENDKFVVMCPFASQVSFEVRIYPKTHQPYFEKMDETDKQFFADALREALGRVYVALNDPDYNFYIHTSPCDGADYDHYHWHFIIIPKTAIWAGFELGTGIEISTIEPEKAAEFLKGIKK